MERKSTRWEGPYLITYNINRYHFANESQRDLLKSKIPASKSKKYGEIIRLRREEQEKYMRQAMWDDATRDMEIDAEMAHQETLQELKWEAM